MGGILCSTAKVSMTTAFLSPFLLQFLKTPGLGELLEHVLGGLRDGLAVGSPYMIFWA